jgi:hypothetical protein
MEKSDDDASVRVPVNGANAEMGVGVFASIDPLPTKPTPTQRRQFRPRALTEVKPV